MPNRALLRKLGVFADLSVDEVALLEGVTENVRTTAANSDIVSEGDRPGSLHLIVDGWAARYKTLPNGSRQITAFLLPGDFCDLHGKILKRMDHSIVALTQCKVAWLSSDAFDQLTFLHPELTRALWWGTLLDEAILREWIVNNSRRDAYQRLAHLFCELAYRLHVIGLADERRLDLPLTQTMLAEATGLTAVHVNRTLQRLRGDGLIHLSRRILTILDFDRLKEAAGFKANYLQIARRVR